MIPPDVVAAIFPKQNKILLQFRINTPRSPLHWGLPAGRVEPEETGGAAISREMMEELGISFVPTGGPDFSCTSEGGRRFGAYVVGGYTGEITNNEPQHCGELAWFDLDELPDPLTPATAELLRIYRTHTE
jgi:ADP-ribose pyrophosphatase YjhB (NUDIX family)